MFDVEEQEVLRVIVLFLASAERYFIAAVEESYCFDHLQQFLAHSENLMTSWMNDL